MQIKLAKSSDIYAIKTFIKDNWKQNHIFVQNDSFFNYEMCAFGEPNFAIALVENKIIGILGFTCNRESIQDSDLFLVMFRVVKSQKTVITGVKLIKFLMNLTSAEVHTVGANKKILTYYKFLGFQIGNLNHYYWLNNNPTIQKFFCKKSYSQPISLKSINKVINDGKLEEISKDVLWSINFDLHAGKGHKLIKSKNFFLRRYAKHPIYSYSFYKSDTFNGLGVVRKVDVEGFLGWKIIDWYGELKYFDKFCKLLVASAYENNVAFVDLYVKGADEEKLIFAGFQKISDSVIIPNYLEPLVLKNIQISFVTTSKENIFLIRGDGDQDRPSR